MKILSIHQLYHYNNNKTQWYITADNDAKLVLKVNETTKVSIIVLSTNGAVIRTINKGVLQQDNYSIPLNINNQPSGAYYIRLFMNNKAETNNFYTLRE